MVEGGPAAVLADDEDDGGARRLQVGRRDPRPHDPTTRAGRTGRGGHAQINLLPGRLMRSTPVRRILAPNPGVYTLEGTNTWIVGGGPSIVIDPGPDDA